MTNLTPDLIRQGVPDARVYIDSNSNIGILLDGRSYYCGPHGLATLGIFYQPVAVSEVLKKFNSP